MLVTASAEREAGGWSLRLRAKRSRKREAGGCNIYYPISNINFI